MTARLPAVKQGTTFKVTLDYAIGGVPEAVVLGDLSAQVRTDGGSLLTQLAIAADGVVVGRFSMTATPAQTLTWPVGDVFFDVKRLTSGITSATDTVAVEVLPKVTV